MADVGAHRLEMIGVKPAGALATHACAHCGGETPGGVEFCCAGCAAAYAMIQSLGLQAYYHRRRLDPVYRRPKPEGDAANAQRDVKAWIRKKSEDRSAITFLIDGLHCGACMWLIEQCLQQQPGVVSARVSLGAQRLEIDWRPSVARIEDLIALVERLGYRLAPCGVGAGHARPDKDGAFLLRCLAVAGFAAGNIMLFSVSVWSGNATSIAPATRDLFHWISALIAIPAVAYAGRPFFLSAWRVLRTGRTNMDVPISIAIVLAPIVSLHETFVSGAHAYFDSAVTLLFFLLIGRYLDHRTRRAARMGAEYLTLLNQTAARVIERDGGMRNLPPQELRPHMTVLIAPGERIPADGEVIEGKSDIDMSLVNGESAPRTAEPSSKVFAGTLNLTGAIRVVVGKAGEETLLAEIVRLMEAAEATRGRYVQIADRVARYYAPVVHATALASFIGWTLFGGMAWPQALMIAITVLIITCPCALALAVPVVQVVACRRLMRSGILLKSGDALERLASVNHAILDKTGTLTLGRPTVSYVGDEKLLDVAAGMAANSRHPIARAIAALRPNTPALRDVTERPGEGLTWRGPGGEWRLGSLRFAGIAPSSRFNESVGQTLIVSPMGAIGRFELIDQLRPFAREACAVLRRKGPVEICSGDRPEVVGAIAHAVGIQQWHADMSPLDKIDRLSDLAAQDRRTLMIGDGLNDAPSLAAAGVSMAPASGADLAQTNADIVFQGDGLDAVPLALGVATFAARLMRQNLAIALIYNLAATPLAIMGFVTPLVAALAMSSSSILVVLNSMRLNRLKALPENGT